MTEREWEYVFDEAFYKPYIYDHASNRVIAALEFVGEAVERTDSPDRDFPETDANGRVMAAAWELVYACESALEIFETMWPECADDCECVIHTLRRALTNAGVAVAS